MLGRGIRTDWRRSLRALLAAALLAAPLAGLCAATQANTTAVLAQNGADDASLLGPPTGTVLPAPPLTPVAPTAPAVPVSPIAPIAPITPAVPAMPAAPAPVRIALLLPLRSATLGAAAQAVRDGVLAGHEREPAGIALEVLETGDAPQDVLPAYAAAVERFDIVIGPLSRADVTTVAQSGKVTRPTIALSPPQGDAEAMPPARMLVAGLSLEDEARQVAGWIGADHPGAAVFVIAADGAWQQRAARAFTLQARPAGISAQGMTLAASGGNLDAAALAQLRRRIATERPQALFAALDAQQALQLRAAIGDEIPLYGTSQLNPLAQAEWAEAEPVSGLEGARLVDIPWQVQRDHPAVMIYPHSVEAGKRERLYALGIDAYRVAREVAAGHSDFTLDGVTGRLTVRFGNGNGISSLQRSETEAVYRDGRVQALTGTR